jgi:hypothetical protein
VGNTLGRAQAMTVLSVVRPLLSWPPGGVRVQRFVFACGRVGTQQGIRDLSMIHFARFVVVEHFPDDGEEIEGRGRPLQLFESNYNGTFDAYIDTFVERIAGKMRALWGWSYGFPGRLSPSGPFKRYIHINEFDVEHYYAAYPEATVTMVAAAQRLQQAHAAFAPGAKKLSAREFEHEFREFVTRVQRDL